MMKAGAELAGEVTDQVKKGWDLMKKKGLPMLSRFAQSTRSKVASMTKEVSSQVQSKKKESASNKEKENKDKPSMKESDSSEEDNDNDVAYLSPVCNKHSTAP